MTTPVLTSKKSFFADYIMYRIKSQKVTLILNSIFNFLGMPLVVISLYLAILGADVNNNNRPIDTSFFAISVFLGIFSLVVIFFLALFNPALNFRDLNRRTEVDTLVSLPLTKKQCFWGNFLSGLFVIVGPFIVSSIITVFFTFLIKLQLGRFPDFPGSENIVSFVIVGILTILIIYISAYVVSVFVTNCCGKVIDSIIFSIITIIALPSFTVLCYNFIFLNTYGMGDITKDILMVIPPLGTLIGSFFNFENFFTGEAFDIKMFGIANFGILFTILLIIAVFIVGAYYINKHRKAEKVGKHFVYDAVYHVLTFSLISVIVGVFMYINEKISLNLYYNGTGNDSAVITIIAFIVTAILYMFIEIANKGGFKKFYWTAIRYVIIVASSFVLFSCLKEMDGFGIYKYVPEISDIESAAVFSDELSYSVIEKNDVRHFVVFKEQENLELITNAHKKIINDKLKTGQDLEIKYNLKDGSSFTRYYDISNVEGIYDNTIFYDLQEELSGSTEYIGQILKISDENLSRLVNFQFSQDKTYDQYNFLKSNNQKLIIDTLRDDMINNNEAASDYYGELDIVIKMPNGTHSAGSIPIKSSYKNTIALLEKEKSPHYSIETKYGQELYSIYNNNTLDCTITDKEIDSKAAQELISLMKYEISDNDVFMVSNYIMSGRSMSISNEHKERALELIDEINEIYNENDSRENYDIENDGIGHYDIEYDETVYEVY